MALHQDHTSEVQNIAYPTFPALPLLPAGLLLLLLLPLLLPLLRPSKFACEEMHRSRTLH